MDEKIKLVYILGSGHCGSTLLNLMLNGHPELLGLSEIQDIYRFLKSKQKQQKQSANLIDDDFWQGVRQYYEHTFQTDFDRVGGIHWKQSPLGKVSKTVNPKTTSIWSLMGDWRRISNCQPEDIAEWVKLNQNLFEAISQQAEVKMLVDASKAWQRLYLLHKSNIFDLKVIHLVRNGKAVLNSYIRRHGEFNSSLRKWFSPSVAAFFLRQQFAEHNWLQIRYEELTTQPRVVLPNICTWLNLDYCEEMLAFNQHGDRGIGGNQKTIHTDKIALDEKWKQELSWQYRLLFQLWGGWLNRYYGY